MNSRIMIDQLCRIAAEAGDVILGYYKTAMRVTVKADRSPLSEADRASHDFLMEALSQLRPDMAVVSEESSEDRRAAGVTPKPYWLVDPLDGTKEFLKGTGEFTVNIALIEAGRPVLGVVFAPALGLCYYATRETGAWKKQGAGNPIPIRTRPADPARLAIVASKDHAGPRVAALLARVPDAQLKSMGSSLKFCLVAEGSADLYLRDIPTMEWDTGAAQCVVEAAGGEVCDLNGRPLEYSKADLRNPSLMTVGDRTLDWKLLLD